MSKKFYPKDGRPAVLVSSPKDIEKYMGEIMNDFGPIEIQEEHVLTQINGQYIQIGELR